jgi:cysteinyl-tRNA synthetase
MDERKASSVAPRALAVARCAETLGLLQERPEEFLLRRKRRWTEQQGLSSDSIEAMIRERDQARRKKQWSEADRIRAELQEKGVILEDTPGGTLWKVK